MDDKVIMAHSEQIWESLRNPRCAAEEPADIIFAGLVNMLAEDAAERRVISHSESAPGWWIF